MFFSIITTCKNRLEHLKQTLPSMTAVAGAEIVVVDYGCEQGTAAWVKANHPEVRVITVTDDPVFHVARARNIGASQAKHDIVCFIDADNFVLGDLSEWVLQNFHRGSFFLVDEVGTSAAGFLLCHKMDFFAVAGYDEALRGWAPEDMDLYERIEQSGIKREFIRPNMFSSIDHGDELRQFGDHAGAFRSRAHAHALGAFYRILKRDVKNLTGKEPDLAFRKQLFEQIKHLDRIAEENERPSFNLVVNMGQRTLKPSKNFCELSIEYKFNRVTEGVE